MRSQSSSKRQKTSRFLTYQFRVKDATIGRELRRMADAANLVWNFCNETSEKAWKRDHRWLTWIDMSKLTSGASKEIGLNAQSINEVVREHYVRRRQFKRSRLSWRSRKRSLGWVPFGNQKIWLRGSVFQYSGIKFRIWKTREIQGRIKAGSFSQDARGRWYLNLKCELPKDEVKKEGPSVGVDLGYTDQVVTSDGNILRRENMLRKYEERIAMAQRANKLRLVRTLCAKMRNARKDWSHKTTTWLVRNYGQIIVGDVNSKAMIRKGFAKPTQDACWYQFKTMLGYKAIALGVDFRVVNESFSTVLCSGCGARTGPSGLKGLEVRAWECLQCGDRHERNINAAKNILRFGLGHQAPEGIPVV